jgi:hypothetical protein
MIPHILAFPDPEAFDRMGEKIFTIIGILLLLALGAAVLAIIVTRRDR